MKNRFLAIAIAVIGLGGPATHARADVLYNGSGFLTGAQSFTDTLNLPSAGILTVTLGDIAWPDSLASLNLVVTSASGAVGPEMGIGTSTFAITSGGVITTQWFGTAQGALNAGVYTLEIQFQPSAQVVPLPASLTLLLSGLSVFLWQRKRAARNLRPALVPLPSA